MEANNNIKFYVGFDVLEKGGKSKDMIIGGIASTKDKDSDGEFLDPKGFELEHFLEKGFINWHHQSSTNPSSIIGEPIVAEIKDGDFYVEAKLYNGNETAESIYKLAQTLKKSGSKRKLGFSIEGKVLERDLENDKIVKKARITGLAITHMPKNPSTLLDIIKGNVIVEEYDIDSVNNLNNQISNSTSAMEDNKSKGATEKDTAADSPIQKSELSTKDALESLGVDASDMNKAESEDDEAEAQKAFDEYTKKASEAAERLKKAKAAKGGDMAKSEDVEKLFELSNQILKAIDASSERNDKIAHSGAVIMKSMLNEQSKMSGELSELREQVELLKAQTDGAKSITNRPGSKAVEREFVQKAETGVGSGIDASSSAGKAKIIDALQKGAWPADGTMNQAIASDIVLFESSGTLSQNALHFLKANGIQVL